MQRFIRFQDLPRHLKASLFSEWISVNDLASFDCALVNREARLEFLDILRSSTLVVSAIPKIQPEQDLLPFFHWLLSRHLLVSGLRLTNTPAQEVGFLISHPALCRPLEVIEFSRIDGVPSHMFHDLIVTCPGLKKFDLSFCGQINDSFFSSFIVQTPENIVQNVPNDHADGSDEEAHPAEVALPVINSHFSLPNLQQMILNNCPQISNSTISMLCSLVPNLSQLHCRGLSRLTDDSLRMLALMPHLQDLDYSLCRQITDKGLGYLATTNHSDTLSSLSVYYCRNISDRSIVDLVQRHTMLQTLNVAGCHHFTNDGLVRLATCCKENLLSLTLTGCIKVSGHGVRTLAMHCRMLKELSLSHCREVDDVCVIALWRFCERMEWLSLKECEKVTDAAFNHKTFVWNHLRHLDLDYVTQVGDVGLLAIASNCPKLVRLRLTGCHKLTLPYLRRATTINAKLHIHIDQD